MKKQCVTGAMLQQDIFNVYQCFGHQSVQQRDLIIFHFNFLFTSSALLTKSVSVAGGRDAGGRDRHR